MKSHSNKSYYRIAVILSLLCLVASGVSIRAEETIPDVHNNVNETAPVWRDHTDGIPVTRWMDAEGRKPISYAEWKAQTGDARPFASQLVAVQTPAKNTRGEGLFCILVNSDLYGNIEAALDQYMIDVAADGFTVSIHTISGGTPSDLRLFLQGKYGEGMVGAVLVGDLPIPWYEANCWDPVEHEEFPCDFYYMDLDGIWEDIDADEKYDEHYGNVTPEVWIGRLTASPMTYDGADEVSLLQNYFVKNHLYRTGQMILNDRGLAFVDDDWEPWAGSWGGNLGQSCSAVTTISDPNTTTAPNYVAQLPLNYESILVCAHSSPNTHWFKIPAGTWTTIDYDGIVDIDPVAVFYNLFACSNARYVESNYMSGWYIFCQSYGLASIGSTKTGSMLEFGGFYGPFGNGKTIGESFADWFTSIGNDGYEIGELCWHYGMTLCGDPTLKRITVSMPSIITETTPDGFFGDDYLETLEAVDGTPPYSWLLIDGILPKNLNLDADNGIISGNANEVGTYEFTVEVTDLAAVPHSDTAIFQIQINYLCGDANNDQAINVADAVFLINHIFKAGPYPDLDEAADANCDGATNVADCVFLINFVFSGGPEPCCR